MLRSMSSREFVDALTSNPQQAYLSVRITSLLALNREHSKIQFNVVGCTFCLVQIVTYDRQKRKTLFLPFSFKLPKVIQTCIACLAFGLDFWKLRWREVCFARWRVRRKRNFFKTALMNSERYVRFQKIFFKRAETRAINDIRYMTIQIQILRISHEESISLLRLHVLLHRPVKSNRCPSFFFSCQHSHALLIDTFHLFNSSSYDLDPESIGGSARGTANDVGV